jgi:2-polyprenyl-6-methoxyphenol hydroxylase-like FAD-dependent oxidoreductase
MSARDHVIVAGAGPVGLTAALLLADAGVPVTVLEKRAELSAASKASTFHPPTLAILRHLGVLDAVRDRGEIVRRLQYRSAKDGIFAEFSLDALRGEAAFPYRLHLEQAQVTPLLLARLHGHAHARVLFDAELLEVGQEGDAATARIRHAGAEETITGAYLVGADGSRSDVRRALGIAFEGEDYPDKILRVMTADDLDVLLPGIAPVTYLFNGSKSVSFLRMRDCWRIILRVAKEVDDATALAPEWILARLKEAMPQCERLPAVLAKDIYGVSRRVAASYRAGRVVLAGDSAHITNTRGGMNMNCGIHDAYAVALGIVRALRGEGPAAVVAAADERRRVATTMLIPRTDRNVAGGEKWLDQVRSMAADPAQALSYLRTTAMLDMTALPAAGR